MTARLIEFKGNRQLQYHSGAPKMWMRIHKYWPNYVDPANDGGHTRQPCTPKMMCTSIAIGNGRGLRLLKRTVVVIRLSEHLGFSFDHHWRARCRRRSVGARSA
jgi:hypothetical protein